MKFRVVHKTEYAYADLVTYCHNEAHLLPRNGTYQTCLVTSINIDPLPADYSEREDFFGNRVCYFSIHDPHNKLLVTATSEIQLEEKELEISNNMAWNTARERLLNAQESDIVESRQYMMDSPLVRMNPKVAGYAQPSFTPGRPLLDAVTDLMERIHRDFEYDPEVTTVSTPLSEVLNHRRGVCQDFAHLAIGCLRSMGLASRYVSGYLETAPPEGQQRLVGADASHAWFSVFFPETGWLDFDPTNNQIPMNRHIVTAWGRDFSDVTPLKGVIFGGGAGHDLNVSVDVERMSA